MVADHSSAPFVVLAVLGWVLSVAQPVSAQPVANEEPRRVRLVFDDQTIQDPLRAQVYGLISQSVPQPDWPTLRIAEPTNIPVLLDDYFDLYANGAGATPETQKLLADMIATANADLLIDPAIGRLAAGDVKVPPVPVRGYSSYNNAVDSRLFDPVAMTYAMSSSAGTSVVRVDEEMPAAANNSAVRQGKLTKVLLPITDAVMDYLRRSRNAVRLLLALDDNDGIAAMNLLDDRGLATCNSASTWLAGSPYRASLAQAMTAGEITKLQNAAANLPLVVVDWNTGDPKGHGAKVRGVVSETLAALGLASLDQYVKTVELNPMRNRAGLRAILVAYKAHVVALSGPDIAKEFEGAEAWVANHRPTDEYALTQQVHSLVLQAIFWSHFRRPGAINLSFTTDSVALKVLDANFMIGARAFGAFAAGNSGMPLSPRLQPQAAAYQWPNVVNVTHGHPDGAIDGDISNEAFKIPVNLVAPGCGYSTPPLSADDTGSSFASPYVLTAAWIRMLQGVPAAAIKRSLITASLPIPAVGQRVESGGLFDPALLLVRPGSHLVTAQGVFLSLTNLRFVMTYSANGVEITLKSSVFPEPTHVVTFQPCPTAGAVCTTVRRWLPDGTLWMTSGPITAVTLEATTGQQTIKPPDAAALLTLVRLITF